MASIACAASSLISLNSHFLTLQRHVCQHTLSYNTASCVSTCTFLQHSVMCGHSTILPNILATTDLLHYISTTCILSTPPLCSKASAPARLADRPATTRNLTPFISASPTSSFFFIFFPPHLFAAQHHTQHASLTGLLQPET